jgi:hypothetical protein
MTDRLSIPPEARYTVLKHMHDGCTMKEAARRVGVSVATVADWRRQDEDFAIAYKAAQEALSHAAASDSVDVLLKTEATDTEDPKRAMAHVSIARERSKALQWYASKLNPEQYGEKIEHRGTVTQAVVMLPPLDPLPSITASVRPEMTEGNPNQAVPLLSAPETVLEPMSDGE